MGYVIFEPARLNPKSQVPGALPNKDSIYDVVTALKQTIPMTAG